MNEKSSPNAASIATAAAAIVASNNDSMNIDNDDLKSLYYRPSSPTKTLDYDDIMYEYQQFPTLEEFNTLVNDYLQNLSSKKRDKALVDNHRYSLILQVLKDPRNTAISTAQFRFWVKKMFRLSKNNLVCHDNKPVATREDMYNILILAHKEAQHGGRDKTSAVVRKRYSWIPKELIARFVRHCPFCISRRNGCHEGMLSKSPPMYGYPNMNQFVNQPSNKKRKLDHPLWNNSSSCYHPPSISMAANVATSAAAAAVASNFITTNQNKVNERSTTTSSSFDFYYPPPSQQNNNQNIDLDKPVDTHSNERSPKIATNDNLFSNNTYFSNNSAAAAAVVAAAAIAAVNSSNSFQQDPIPPSPSSVSSTSSQKNSHSIKQSSNVLPSSPPPSNTSAPTSPESLMLAQSIVNFYTSPKECFT